MAYDWADTDRTDALDFVMVSPQNLDVELGTLEGVVRSASSLSAAYYTDTRTSGKLEYVGDGWIRNSFIRIVHRIPEWGFRRELGTYIVTEDPGSREAGQWTRSLTLHSVLHGLATDLGSGPWTVAQGASLVGAMGDMLSTCGRPWDNLSATDMTANSPIVYETGTSFLERLFDLCKSSGNRLDVNGHGVVTVAPYVLPAKRSAAFRLDLADARGLVNDGVELTTNYLEMPGRAVVSYQYSETVDGESVQREINASADATGEQSSATRGYMVTEFEHLSEMEPATYQRALELAQQKLAEKGRELVEWKIKCLYLPIWEGDVVELVVHDGPERYRGVRHCLVKNVELELEHMGMTLTLKETASGDDE